MGTSENHSVNYAVELTKKCESEYKKLRKRGDPNLLREIAEYIEQLKTNPNLGEQLIYKELKGMRSIHLNRYHFRILYVIRDNPVQKVIILKIDHRKDFYSDYERYLIDIEE